MDKDRLIGKYFPHWEHYLSMPSHLSNQSVFSVDQFISEWQTRLCKPLPPTDDDIDIDVSDLTIKPLNDEIDSQLAAAMEYFSAMPNPDAEEEQKECKLRPEVVNIRRVLDHVKPKTLQQMTDERSGLPTNSQEKQYLPLKSVALGHSKE